MLASVPGWLLIEGGMPWSLEGRPKDGTSGRTFQTLANPDFSNPKDHQMDNPPHPSLSTPGATLYPKVTELFCRLPLHTLCSEARDSKSWKPAAVYRTTGMENDKFQWIFKGERGGWRALGKVNTDWGGKTASKNDSVSTVFRGDDGRGTRPQPPPF